MLRVNLSIMKEKKLDSGNRWRNIDVNFPFLLNSVFFCWHLVMFSFGFCKVAVILWLKIGQTKIPTMFILYHSGCISEKERVVVFLRRLSRRLEDDLYLQCDLTDDAIYSNDPACSLSILTHPQEEDVYIVPDAWLNHVWLCLLYCLWYECIFLYDL